MKAVEPRRSSRSADPTVPDAAVAPAPARAVQRRTDDALCPGQVVDDVAPGDWSFASALNAGIVQRDAVADTDLSADLVHAAAARGIAGSGGALPHLAAIQRSFGRHDVSGVRAHVGGAAAEASAAMDAHAYATGDQVAFAAAPDLHLAAHEAAHVVQQRGGVQLSSGVGRVGDVYEQHADAVADAVVRGESAQGLLDAHATGGSVAVQRGGGPLATEESARGGATLHGGGATPPSTGCDPEVRHQIDHQLDLARAALLGDHHSVFGCRRTAVSDFVHAPEDGVDTEVDSGVLAGCAIAALSVASGGIAGIVAEGIAAELATAVASEAAKATAKVIEAVLEEVIGQIAGGVASEARDAARPQPHHSLASYGELQDAAIRQATRNAGDAFEAHRSRFYAANNGLEQATALTKAYVAAQEPAYATQSLATYAQWARTLQHACEGSFGWSVLSNMTGEIAEGILTLGFTVDLLEGGDARLSTASLGGMSPERCDLIRRRAGTLGDLFGAGLQMNIDFGTSQMVCQLDQGITATAMTGSGFPHYAERRYGSFDRTQPNAYGIGAAIVFAREISGIPLSSLPAIG